MISLGPILGVLGVKLLMVEDPEAMARYTDKLPKRNKSCVHNGAAITFTFSRRHMQKIGQKGSKVRWKAARKMHTAAVQGGTNSRKNMTARQARALARKAARARWAKARWRERRYRCWEWSPPMNEHLGTWSSNFLRDSVLEFVFVSRDFCGQNLLEIAQCGNLGACRILAIA